MYVRVLLFLTVAMTLRRAIVYGSVWDFLKLIILLTHLSDLVCFRHNGRLNLGTPAQRSHNGADSRVIFIHHLSSYKFGKLLPLLIIYRMLCFTMWYTGAESR